MMRIAITSNAASVRRTLESIVHASGHHLASCNETADLRLVDQCHPADASPTAATLQLIVPHHDPVSIDCPLRPEQLIQRLILHEQTRTHKLSHGWVLNILSRTLEHTSGAAIPLTEKECALLGHLAAASPKTIGRTKLLEAVWGVGTEIDTHTLETHMYRLRGKCGELSPSPCDILTEDGAYRLAITS